MHKDFEDSLIKYNTKHSRLHEKVDMVNYNNNILVRSLQGRGTAVAHGDANNIEITYANKEELARNFLKDPTFYLTSANNILEMEKSNDPLFKRKVEAINHILKETKGYKSYQQEPLTEKQLQILADFTIAHELSHVHFYSKNTPNYDNNINNLPLYKTEGNFKNTVGLMREEIRADTLALLLIKQEYGNDPDLKIVMDRIADKRLLGSVLGITDNSSAYSMYHVYKNDMAFIHKLPPLNKGSLKDIEYKIDEVVIKTIKDFGIQSQLVNENNKVEELKESIQEVGKDILRFCQSDNARVYDKVMGSSLESCLNHLQYNETVKNNKQLDDFLNKVPVADGFESFNLEKFAQKQKQEDQPLNEDKQDFKNTVSLQ